MHADGDIFLHYFSFLHSLSLSVSLSIAVHVVIDKDDKGNQKRKKERYAMK